MWSDWIGSGLAVIGAAFFVTGTIGLLRFPDVLSRLHALTKVDTLGLGFLLAGLALQSASVAVALRMGLIWALAMCASAVTGHLIARQALRESLWKDMGT